jgi:hypothetical protein
MSGHRECFTAESAPILERRHRTGVSYGIRFLILGLHKDAASAHHFFEARHSAAPWLRIALESWSAVLQPTRHKGEANYLNREEPGPLFEVLAPELLPTDPFVAITTSGWNIGKGHDTKRVNRFSTGVNAVRMAMTGVDGLHSHQSFYFPRVLEYDQMTVTFWRNDDAASAYLYGPGVHRLQMDRQRDKKFADRTPSRAASCCAAKAPGTAATRWPGTNVRAGSLLRGRCRRDTARTLHPSRHHSEAHWADRSRSFRLSSEPYDWDRM